MMLNETLFESNLDLFSQQDPKTSLYLANHIISSKMQFCKTSKDELNIVFKGDEEDLFFHSNNGAKEEAEKWYRDLDLKEIKILVIYGIGLGYYYDACKEWLRSDPENVLIFMEDEIDVFGLFFQTEKATEILRDKQVKILNLQNLSLSIFLELFWTKAFDSLLIEALALYSKKCPDKFYLLYYSIYQYSEISSFEHKEYFLAGQVIQNLFLNYLNLPNDYYGPSLFGKFKDIPAVICGAGPSLEKQIPFLKKIKDKALIFGGGTSLNILTSHDFSPHFGAGVDPNEEQIHRLMMNDTFTTPFFYEIRMKHDAVKFIQGDKLRLVGSSGYRFPEWLDQNFGISGQTIDEGMNVVHVCMAIAKFLGCNPIVFVGMDLAFTDEKTHSSGVGINPLWLAESNPYKISEDTAIIFRKDIHGNQIGTKWMWVCESSFISSLVSRNPSITYVNSTEGGIGFANVPNIPFAEVIERYMAKEMDLQGRIHGEIQNSHLPKTATVSKLLNLLNDLKKSLKNCHECTSQILNEMKLTREKMEQSQKSPMNMYSGKAVLYETMLGEEIGYRCVLKTYDDVFIKARRSYIARHRQILDQDAYEKDLSQIRTLEERYSYLTQIANLYISIITAVGGEAIRHFATPAPPVKTLIEPPNPPISDHLEKKCLYYPNGNLKMEEHYKNKILHGPSRYFNEDGNILSYTDFRDGKREGECLYYYLSGALYSQKSYQKGLQEGKETVYFEDGKIRTELHFSKGSLHGDIKTYYPTGRQFRFLQYAHGKRHGIEKKWDEEGNLIFEVKYSHGVPIGLSQEWKKDGKLYREVVVNKYPEKYESRYYDEGDLISITKDGKFDWVFHHKVIEEKSLKVMKELRDVFEKFDELIKALALVSHTPDAAEKVDELKKQIEDLEKLRNSLLFEAKAIIPNEKQNPGT